MKRLLLTGLVGAIGILALGVMDAWTALGARPEGTRLERMLRSPQYSDGKFHNDLPEKMDMFRASWRWLTGGSPYREPSESPPIVHREKRELEVAPDSGLRVTWLGHSTSILDIDGARILIDPVFGERCSPSRFAGPKRFHEPPLPLSELPPLDAVVISHDHYDHLDLPTIEGLKDQIPTFVVPLGVGAHLESWGVDSNRITELDWWESTKVKGLEIFATPARHFSGRSHSDRNRTLWSGFAILGPEHRFYYSGDTAMFGGFKQIGERFGPFDASMIEVGAYDKSWADVHLGPEQAIDAHQAVRGGLMIGVHWGTFNLALHGWTEPVERLLVAAKKAGVSLAVPRPGESIEPQTPPEIVRWWPDLPWQTVEEHAIISSGLEESSEMALNLPSQEQLP